MLRAIAQEYHFNIIRIYLAWVYCNPKPDQFDFTELEEVMRYCETQSAERDDMGVAGAFCRPVASAAQDSSFLSPLAF
ncbi:MAG: hypothetical protein DMG25_14115 [Acidobacteria bacterium]|nr:MAG: hypothetical protein DMG25_14115 [Acidobacteriota bacterium]